MEDGPCLNPLVTAQPEQLSRLSLDNLVLYLAQHDSETSPPLEVFTRGINSLGFYVPGVHGQTYSFKEKW